MPVNPDIAHLIARPIEKSNFFSQKFIFDGEEFSLFEHAVEARRQKLALAGVHKVSSKDVLAAEAIISEILGKQIFRGRMDIFCFGPQNDDEVPPHTTTNAISGTESAKFSSIKAKPASLNVKSDHNIVLGVIGIITLLIGLGFLIAPGIPTEIGSVVNIHKLTMGQTLTIVGAIFIAVQWRPR